MTLRELRYLVALADHGHFGRAAQASHVSQPTLSTQLKKLENYLGATLVERGAGNVQLTEIGQKVVAHARSILSEADFLIASTRGRSAPLQGSLRVGIIPTLSPYFLPWLLPAARREFPQLHPIVHEGLTDHLIESLRGHRLDVAILALPLDSDEFETLAAFDEAFWLACPEHHPLAAQSRVDLKRLRRQDLLLLTDGHCLREQALEVCGLRDLPGEDGDFRATSLETLCQLVAGGFGCTLLPALAARAFSGSREGLRIRPLARPRATRRIGLAWRRRSPRHSEFLLLAQLLAALPPRGTQRIPADEPCARAAPACGLDSRADTEPAFS